MFSTDLTFVRYNFEYSSYNTFRFLTMHKFGTNLKNTHLLFSLKSIKLVYTSSVISDLDTASLLGAFLIIKFLTNQFPYISKYKMTSTFMM